MTGPPPLPTHLRILEGNRSRRPLNENEPKPKQVMPECPDHLSDEAKKQWNKLGKQLFDVGILTELDGDALAMYCDAWARWVNAKEMLDKHGAVFKSKNGFPALNPYFAVASQAFEQMRRILQEFGMTPSSRTRLGVEPKSGKSEMEKLID